ncbi:hypothetical protein [Octadecabacter arcticus]|jgi:hypothetical protein|uniref:AbiU2 domain-containing protein n=1 Tax=Octadecabacter arcticus TaxID=53946 RepID=UPI0002E50255|nr:hypothetical protein [Octadecabacter arcticus]
MAEDDQIELAKHYTNKLTDLVIAAKAANENTRHVVYSSRLVGQIPRSYAALAFKDLQNTLLYFSVVRACSLFDKAANDRVSLHTVIRAISNKKTVRKVARETYRYHANQGEPRRLTPEDDPEIRKLLADHCKKYSDERGRKEEQLVYRRVRVAQKVVGRAERLLIKDHLRPFRDNFIAHNLTDSTRNGTQISFMLGMENRAIQHAKCAVNQLHLALNGAGFDWEGLEKIQRRNASEFWDNLNFELPDDTKA